MPFLTLLSMISRTRQLPRAKFYRCPLLHRSHHCHKGPSSNFQPSHTRRLPEDSSLDQVSLVTSIDISLLFPGSIHSPGMHRPILLPKYLKQSSSCMNAARFQELGTHKTSLQCYLPMPLHNNPPIILPKHNLPKLESSWKPMTLQS